MPNGFFRRFLSVIMVLMILVGTMSVMGGSVVSAAEVEKAEISADDFAADGIADDSEPTTDEMEQDYKLELPYGSANGLYAYAGVQVEGTNAWQRWDNVNNKRYFYLPGSASDTEVVVLNTYSSDVTLASVTIPAGEYRTVPYVSGTTYTCSGATTQSVAIYKTDAEGTIFINSAVGMTTKNDAGVKSTINDATYDLYSFLISGTKNQEAGKVAGAVATAAEGVDEEETTIKKIKGRGNTTWDLAKKPFNITYDENVVIDGMKGKKWSLLANAQDPSLMRNRMIYDISNEVGMNYACDSRFVDMFVNGDYKGTYQLTQKIEMGKNTVMADLEEPLVEIEEEGDVVPTEDFDFILEVDMAEKAASAGDLTFKSGRGQVMTHKVPDEPTKEQIAFMKSKYQAFEDALYSNDMATLEKLIDIEDLARAYLINEITKNLDAALTSCYFVYNSTDEIFYASPVWDFDNAVGNTLGINDRKDINGNVLDTKTPNGWYARELLHIDSNYDPNGVGRTIFSQACYMTQKTSKGQTFMELAKEIWDTDFADILDILNGTATADNGRLKSVSEYMSYLENSGKWNYTAWTLPSNANNSWVADHSKLKVYSYDALNDELTSTQKTYNQNTFAGQQEFAVDWLVSRMNWLAAQFAAMDKDPVEDYVTIYFAAESSWNNVFIYGFYGEEGKTAESEWPGPYPGTQMTYVETDANNKKIYSIDVPADIDFIKFSDGSSSNRRTNNAPASMIKEGAAFVVGSLTSSSNKWDIASYSYTPSVTPEDPAEPDAPETSAPADPDPTEGEDVSQPETTPAPTPAKSVYAVRGTFTSWDTTETLAYANGSTSVVEGVFTIQPGKYEFKICNISNDTWYGNDGSIEEECSNWGFRTGKNKCKITSADGGVYKFTINIADTSRLGVTIEKISELEQKTGVYVNGQFIEAEVGKVVKYTVNLKTAELFENIQAYISYDATKLSIVRKDNHPTLTEREIACPGLDGVFYPDVDGIATFNASKVQGYDFTQGNVLVTLEFTVEAEGESAIELVIQEMSIKGEDGRSYFRNGKAQVTEGIELTQVAVIADAASDPVEAENSGIHYVVTEDGKAQITYYTGSVSELVIPAEIGGYTVTGIADYAFYDCTVLKSVVLPDTLTTIGAYAFYCCDELEVITIPASVTEIGKKAFAQDTALADVYYLSTEAAWQTISIGQENECLTNATIHYVEEPATPDEPSTEPTEPSEPSEPQEKYFTVTFMGYNGNVIDTQTVKEGESATAPDAPKRAGYNFVGWDAEFTNVTADITVTALYEKKPAPPAPTTGVLKLDIAGGTGFTIIMNGGAARPQGAVYLNSNVTIGTVVTVEAKTTADSNFLCWMDSVTGVILSTTPEFTFITSGNDSFKALFEVPVEGVQMVTFKNDKSSGGAGRLLDNQYYSATDKIEFPDAPTQVGFDFAGWSMTMEEIQAAIAAGQDVTVLAKWTRQNIPVNVTVNGGTGTGVYNANSAVTVVANAAPAGQKFAYWTDAQGNIKSYSEEYIFYPAEDAVVTAVFVEQDAVIDYNVLVSLDSIDTTSIADKNVFTYSWYCPEQFEFVKAGIVAVNKDNYNEETFCAGTSDTNVYDRSPSGVNAIPANTYSWTKSSVTSGQTWVAKAYVQYRDENGTLVTVYSDEAEATKD